MSIVRFNPLREMLNMEKEFNKMFNNFENRFGVSKKEDNEDYENAVWMPLTDISEEKDAYKLQIDIPGVDKKDVKISFADGKLIISGERKEEKVEENKETKYHRIERTYGKFFRSFTLPKEIAADKIEAEYINGQLMVMIPKTEEAKPKELEIKVK